MYYILSHIGSFQLGYNSFLVYCRELAPGTVSLTGDRAQGDDSKHDSHYIHVYVYHKYLDTLDTFRHAMSVKQIKSNIQMI